MKTAMNNQTSRRYYLIRKLVGDASNKVIIDIGAGDLPISGGINAKKVLTLDGDKNNHPDILCDLASKEWPIEKESADIVIAGEIIEHLDDNLSFLKECNRVLKTGGRIILSTPNTCSLKNRIKMIFGKLPEYCAGPKRFRDLNHHLTDFNLPELTKLLSDAGFRILRTRTNGIVSHSRIFWPSKLTPTSFGEILVVEAVKL